jgi:hypothetical protein
MRHSAHFKALQKCVFFAAAAIMLSLCCTLVSCGPGGEDEEPEPENEEIFINEVSASGDDWIELYNTSDEARNIGGYKIFDDETAKYTLPSNATVPAKGFLVLICDGTGVDLHPDFKLSADGETVYLENASGKLIDKIEFPAMGDGQSYARFPDAGVNISLTGNTSQGVSNNNANAPVMSDYFRAPLVPGLADNVTVSITVTGTVTIANVKLYYRFDDGGFTEGNMTANGSVYTAVIPAQNDNGEVEYYIKATNTTGGIAFDPAEAPVKLHDYLLNSDPLPGIKLNEIMAANASCCPDPAGITEEFDDWIEIYNPTASPIDIGGMYLSDNPDNPFGSKIPGDEPALTTIPAHGFIVLWADEQGSQGPLHLNFRLSAAGETIGLYYIDGRQVDIHTFDAQVVDTSEGRDVDGTGDWIQFDTPTQNASNE